MNTLTTVEKAAELIRNGKSLGLAGPESALDQLPPGDWVGGTIPYVMLSTGGIVLNEDKVFVTDLTAIGPVQVDSFGPDELAEITRRGPENGFALTIIPCGSECHRRFAADAASYEGAFLKPTVGWISGVRLSDVGKATPKVYDGRTARKYEDRAVVAHVTVPAGQTALVEIINLFEPDAGDLIRFRETGFEIASCEVNGELQNFAEYVQRRGMEHGKLPLVGDFSGAHINVSLQSVDVPARKVRLFAPVFSGVDYRFAKPVGDYARAFRARLASQDTSHAVMTCNCILNFVFGELEGKAIGDFEGPITFGEIAYQLLNQTAVLVRVL